jgi:hypothetical protein
MVPPSVTSCGMTLYASPALSCVTDSTPEPSGDVSRLTMVCGASTEARYVAKHPCSFAGQLAGEKQRLGIPA